MSFQGILAKKGAPVVFSYSAPGAYDPTTDTTTAPVQTSVTMDAMEIDSDPDLMKALELIGTMSITLICKSRTPVALPVFGTSTLWGGETYTVKHIERLAMAGTPTAAKIVIGR